MTFGQVQMEMDGGFFNRSSCVFGTLLHMATIFKFGLVTLYPCRQQSGFDRFKRASKQQGVTFYFLAPWLVF